MPQAVLYRALQEDCKNKYMMNNRYNHSAIIHNVPTITVLLLVGRWGKSNIMMLFSSSACHYRELPQLLVNAIQLRPLPLIGCTRKLIKPITAVLHAAAAALHSHLESIKALSLAITSFLDTVLERSHYTPRNS